MTELINIDIQRTGFPIKIGTVELWFDSSLENLRKFFNLEELAEEKLKEAQEKARAIHFPDVVDIDTLDMDALNAAMDVNEEFIAAQYDIIFGNGTFDKIYGVYPDILALDQAFSVVCVAIGSKIEQQEAERSSKTEEKKNEYLAKKSKKVGK